MRQVLHVNYLQALPVQAQARPESVNNNIGPNKKNTKVSFLGGLPDIWSDTLNKFTEPTQNLPVVSLCHSPYPSSCKKLKLAKLGEI